MLASVTHQSMGGKQPIEKFRLAAKLEEESMTEAEKLARFFGVAPPPPRR